MSKWPDSDKQTAIIIVIVSQTQITQKGALTPYSFIKRIASCENARFPIADTLLIIPFIAPLTSLDSFFAYNELIVTISMLVPIRIIITVRYDVMPKGDLSKKNPPTAIILQPKAKTIWTSYGTISPRTPANGIKNRERIMPVIVMF